MLTEQMNSEWVAEGRLFKGEIDVDNWFVWVRIGGMKGIIVDHIPQGTAEHIRDTHNAWLAGNFQPPINVYKMLNDEHREVTVKVYLED